MCTPGVVLSLYIKETQAELVDVARDEALTAGGVCFARRWKLLTCTLNPGSGQVQLRRFCGIRGCSRRAFLCGEGGPAHRGLLSIHEPLSGAAVGATAHTGDGLNHVEYCGAPFNWVASAVLRTTVVKSSVGAGLHQIALCTRCRRPCQLGFGCYWSMHPGELRMLRPIFARTIRAAAACWEATHARAAVFRWSSADNLHDCPHRKAHGRDRLDYDISSAGGKPACSGMTCLR